MITAKQRATLADIRKLEGKHISPHMVLELVDLIEKLAAEKALEEPSAEPT